jgi:tyrosine-specific transport protein
MFREKLGRGGSSLFNASYFVLFFCLLVAYFVGIRAIYGIFRFGSAIFWLSVCGMGLCLAFGFKVAAKVNACLTYTMFALFLFLAAKTIASPGMPLTETMNFGAAIFALPVVICSYCFHGAIPLICQQLDGNWRCVRKAIVLGALFPMLFNLSILLIGFRVLTPGDLAEGAKNGWPVFVAMAHRFSSHAFIDIGNLFSIFAILSSLVGVTTTMRGAVRDVCGNRGKPVPVVEFAVILFMPVMVALHWPKIFIKALEFSGGILSNFMVGILPIVVLIKERRLNWKDGVLLAVFLCIFCIEGIGLILHW